MTSLILGGGAAGGIALGGDIGGTNANPQVVGSHFGGSAGNFWVNRAGVWVPDTIKSTDLPAISQLVNGTNSLSVNADGINTHVASGVTIGALNANVASQFLSGNNARGYFRVTISATAITAGNIFISFTFSALLTARAYIFITPTRNLNAQYGDSVGTALAVNGVAYPLLSQNTNSNTLGLSILHTATLTASTSFGFFYQVIE